MTIKIEKKFVQSILVWLENPTMETMTLMANALVLYAETSGGKDQFTYSQGKAFCANLLTGYPVIWLQFFELTRKYSNLYPKAKKLAGSRSIFSETQLTQFESAW